MNLGLDSRRAAVAASTDGLGFATAAALAAEGARVVICGRNEERLHDAISRLGGQVRGILADLSDSASAARFVAEAAEQLGGLDILITNAGGPPAGTFETTEFGSYVRAINENLYSVIAMCQTAVPYMKLQGWGRIVAITSVTVRQPIANLIASTTARAGTTGFLKTLATEVAPYGITVNSAQPGYHMTNRVRRLVGDDTSGLTAAIPTGTLGAPEDFGALVAMLCSEQVRFLTGASIPIDGGASGGLQ